MTPAAKIISTVLLDVNFFDNHKIRKLAETKDGTIKVLCWLKLICLAGEINDGGRIYERKGEVLNRSFLSGLFGVSEELVGEFLKEFKRLRMIRFDEQGTMFLVNWTKYQGEEIEQLTQKKEKQKEKNEKESFPPTPPLKEKEKKKEKEIKHARETQNIKLNSSQKEEYSRESLNFKQEEIINYLNFKFGFEYLPSSLQLKRLIKRKLKVGYKVDDFKRVIDSEGEKWLGTDKAGRYLNPRVLFGEHFESFLQTALMEEKKKQKTASFDMSDFIEAALNRK